MEFRNESTLLLFPITYEKALSYAVMGYLSIIAILGTVTNTITIHIFWSQSQRLRHLIIINLAIADISSPILTYWMVIASSYYQEWQFGPTGCKIYAFINCLVGMAGIGNLTILSLERYVFLGGSTKQKELIKRLQLPLIASVWVFALITSVPPILGWGRFVQDTFVSSCSFDFYSSDLNAQSYVMYLVTTGFLIPTSIIMSLYVKIYRKIRYYRKYLHQMLSENNDSSKFRFSFLESMKVVAKLQENEEISIRQHPKLSDEILLTDESYPQTARPTNQLNFQLEIPIVQRLALAEIEFAKQAFFAIIGYLICWSPYALLSVLCQTNVTTCYHPLASAITLMMAKTSVAINPIIYAFSDKGFLKSLRNRLTFKVTSFS